METEKTRHEAEEGLIAPQFSTSQKIPHKLQNGSQSSEENSLGITRNNNWNHYKTVTSANSMKRHRDSCDSPSSVHGLYDQGSYIMNGEFMNGEMNRGLTDQSLLMHQPKKLKVDSEIKENDNLCSSMVENFPELTKATDFECNGPQTNISLDKRNCKFPNGDIFCLSRNKPASISNGAPSPSSTIESTPGDLLEKTLSQYYPEQVSIASQTSGLHPDVVNGSLANEVPSEGAQPLSLTSGLPTSISTPAADQQQPAASCNTEGSNNYNSVSYVANGYSNNYTAEHQQEPHQLQPQPYSSHGQLPAMILPSNTANNSQQHQNDPGSYTEDSNSHGTHAKPKKEYNQNSFLEQNTPLNITEADEFGSFPISGLQSIGKSEESKSGQSQCHDMDIHYGNQSQSFQQNVGNSCVPDNMRALEHCLQQSHHESLEKELVNKLQQEVNLPCPTTHQRDWMELNSSHSQPASVPSSQAQEQDIWKGFPAQSHTEQQTTNPEAHGQMLEPNPAQRFQTQGIFTDSSQRSNSFQQQHEDCLPPTQMHCASAQHNTAMEWQQPNSKDSQIQQHLAQKMPEQQADSEYCSNIQSKHLPEGNADTHNLLSSKFQKQQQQQHCLQRPLSHPPQFERQQLSSPDYRPHSQPQPGLQELQLNQPNSNTAAQSNNQHNQHNEHAAFSYSNTAEMQQPPQHRKMYHTSSGSSNLKQFPPQRPNNHCHQPNLVDFPQTSTHSHPHLPQGALNQHISTNMYPKLEQQQKTSCSQFQRGPQLPLGPGSAHGDPQRHAALRMHLLQKQKRQGPPHSSYGTSDHKHSPIPIKIENGPRFELPGSQHFEQQLQGRDTDTGLLQVKQESQHSLCEESKKHCSILASMEQSLRQYQLSPVFEKKSLLMNSSSKVKVESSGAVTILSTNTDLSAAELSMGASASVSLKRSDYTPKKEHLLQSFMDSPVKLLDTPIRNLLDTSMKTQYDIASCHCVEQISEKDEGPYYTHLGAAPSVAGIREVMEKRSGLTGPAIRIEKVIYTGKEGKSTQGCPIAKWVIRRSSVEEKLLVLVRERSGHTCDTTCIIVVMLFWDGIPSSLADRLYLELSETLTKHGAHTQRRCALNEERTCACQGLDREACGASFSFGCSWSMYYNGCKFARSKMPRKFKLLGDDVKEEEKLEQNLQNLATILAPLYKTLAPDAYGNQVEHEHRAPDCRLGFKDGRPFSGVTACLDFCAHAHRDLHNMQGGSTVVCTLTREDNREIGKIPEDEQLHVLPLYKPSNTDEFGSEEGQQEKIKSGAIQVLSAFRRQVRMLAEPAKSCRQKKLDAKKAAASKNAMLDNPNDKAEKALQVKSKTGTYENTAQITPMTGPIPGTLQSGQPTNLLGTHSQQLQHHSIVSPYPCPTNPARYPRFANHPGSFPSTSNPSSMYASQQPTPATPYPSPLHMPNPYINGSTQPYPGYQCNGGMPLDNYYPYYASNPKHLDMHQQQQSVLFSDQQYNVHQGYEVNYPPRYGEPGLQVNGYNACGMRPIHPVRPYSPYGPNGASDPQFMGAPPVQPNLDYTVAVSKQFGGYPHPYLSQCSQTLNPGQDPYHMQVKTETGRPLSASLSFGCLNPETHSGLGLTSETLTGSSIKQEPGTPTTPTTPQKPEMWSDNEHNFLDPEIGGVAVAPSHGSVIIECAKRELHATTPLKIPDRTHPTRISLVFYQHKNLNEAKHGLALWEAKMAEKAREKEEEAEKNGGEGTPSKGNKKGVKREHSDSSEPSGEPPYKRFIQALMEGSLSSTTNTYISTSTYAFTKVTGPYSKFA